MKEVICFTCKNTFQEMRPLYDKYPEITYLCICLECKQSLLDKDPVVQELFDIMDGSVPLAFKDREGTLTEEESQEFEQRARLAIAGLRKLLSIVKKDVDDIKQDISEIKQAISEFDDQEGQESH